MAYRRTENVLRRLAARHDAIVDAARAAADTGGMAAIQIAPIAERAGVAAGTVYRYFPGKIELVGALIESVSGREIAELRRAAEVVRVEVPTLASVCELVGDRVELFVEIKGAQIERQVVEVLRGHRGKSAIHSFDHAAIARLARLDGTLRLGLLFEEPVPDVAAMLAACGALDAWPHHSLVDRPLVEAVHRAGGRVIAWTVNDRTDIERLSALGVDGLCTDDVTLVGGS